MTEHFGAKQNVLKSASEKEREHLIVEVGSGLSPLPTSVPESYRRWMHENKGVRYVGIEPVDLHLKIGRDLTEGMDQRQVGDPLGGMGIGTTERIEFEAGDAEHLRFEDGSVSQIIFRNVFGYGVIKLEKRLAMLEEASRVLKPGGALIIVEQYTPAVARDQKIMASIARLAQKEFEYVGAHERTPLERDVDEHFLSYGKDWPDEKKRGQGKFVLRLRKRLPTALRK